MVAVVVARAPQLGCRALVEVLDAARMFAGEAGEGMPQRAAADLVRGCVLAACMCHDLLHTLELKWSSCDQGEL